VIEIIGQLLGLYAALAMVVVGFAMMLGGPLLARSALGFFFRRPIVALLQATASAIAGLIIGTARLIGHVLMAIGRGQAVLARGFITYGIDPLARVLVRVLDTLTPRRGR
jgi:hypothetical protein